MDYLLIFQSVPECLQIYHFYNPDAETVRLLEASHNHYINNDDDEPDTEVSEFLCNLSTDNLIFDDTSSSLLEIAQFKQLTNVKIIVSGIIL